jgi:hypothetical protein
VGQDAGDRRLKMAEESTARRIWRCGSRLAVMAAVVASLVYWPAGILVALACALIGVSPQAILTFGGGMGTLYGMLGWWLILFVLSLPYAAWFFPWDAKIDGFP